MPMLRLMAMTAVVAGAARALVGFAEWRKGFVNRLIGPAPDPQEAS